VNITDVSFQNSAIPMLVVTADEDHKVIDINTAAEKFLGLSRKSLIELPVQNIFESCRSEPKETNNNTLISNLTFKRNGQHSSLQVFSLATKTPDKPIKLLILNYPSDIQHYSAPEDQKMRKAASFGRERLYKEIIDESNALVYVKDPEGRYKFVNRAFKRFFGLTGEQVVGRYDYEVLGNEYYEHIRKGDEKVLQSKEPFRQEEHITINKEKNFFVTQKSVVLSPDKKEHWICGISTDINSQKLTEKELKVALEERNVLLQEVHHRVKNNLAIINAMIELQLFDIDYKPAVKKFTKCQLRIKSIAIIHELLYQSQSLSKVDFKQVLKKMIKMVINSLPHEPEIETSLTLSDVFLNINQGIPLALLINELISEIIFRMAENKRRLHLKISLSELKNERVQIEFKATEEPYLRSLRNDGTKPLSWKLIEILKEQLDAEIALHSDKCDKQYTIRFKRKEVKGAGSNFFC